MSMEIWAPNCLIKNVTQSMLEKGTNFYFRRTISVSAGQAGVDFREEQFQGMIASPRGAGKIGDPAD